jgi:hypothetical protein
MFVVRNGSGAKSPRSHVKYAKDKVEASNFVLQWGHVM